MKSLFGAVKGATIAVLCLTLALPLAGCQQQQTIASLTQILGTAGASVAALEGNSPLATQLTNDTNAAVTAIQNWKQGTAAQEVIEALKIVQDDLSLFPQTNQYAPLIDLALATTESILALLPASSVQASLNHATVRHVTLASPAPKSSKEFKKRWNAIVSQNPQLAKAKLQ